MGSQENMKYSLVIAEPETGEHIKSRIGKWWVNLTSMNKETQDASGFGHACGYVEDLGKGILEALAKVKWPAVIEIKELGQPPY